MIAATLSCNPEILIADEPTTALDTTIKAQILDIFRDLKQERNMSIYISAGRDRLTPIPGMIPSLIDPPKVVSSALAVSSGCQSVARKDQGRLCSLGSIWSPATCIRRRYTHRGHGAKMSEKLIEAQELKKYYPRQLLLVLDYFLEYLFFVFG